ncbi:hypothetical protein cyc_04337 [Cyclospora cayetanensis]|uniref:Transmembrane protein n=1 Tax=Cyclospora cayetanensis TaxID=88456 RepID=A0A1D3CRE4_9EIME|nr:hypothetical protein cyc_04337 [Cyclospora cayetanensis]
MRQGIGSAFPRTSPLLFLGFGCFLILVSALSPPSPARSPLAPEIGLSPEGPVKASRSLENPPRSVSINSLVLPWAPFGVSRVLGAFMQVGSSKEAPEEGEEQAESDREAGESSQEDSASEKGGGGKKSGARRASYDDAGEGSQAEGDYEEESASETGRPEGPKASAGAPEGTSGDESLSKATPQEATSSAGILPPAVLPSGPPSASDFLPQLSYADGDELCHSISCSKVASGCKKAVKCKGCKEGGAPEAKCLDWKPSRQPEILLRSGTYYGLKRISRSGSLDLAIKWDHENTEIDFSGCLLDVKQATLASRELNETGNVRAFAFHRMAQLTLAIARIPEEGAESHSIPKLSFGLKMNNGTGIARAFSTTAKPVVTPACFQSDQRSSVLTLDGQEAAFVVGWFSVPKHKTFPLYPRNFTIRLFCHSSSDCSLSQLAICARLSCPIASPEVEKEVLAAEEAMQHPVGELPPVVPGTSTLGTSLAGGNAMALQAGTSLLAPQQLLQQQSQGIRQLQFRSRYGFMPYWRAAAPAITVSWGVISLTIAAYLFTVTT